MNNNAPEKKRRESAARGFWSPLLVSVYGLGWAIDWAYWARDEAWHHIIFGWFPALLWPIHAASALWHLALVS